MSWTFAFLPYIFKCFLSHHYLFPYELRASCIRRLSLAIWLHCWVAMCVFLVCLMVDYHYGPLLKQNMFKSLVSTRAAICPIWEGSCPPCPHPDLGRVAICPGPHSTMKPYKIKNQSKQKPNIKIGTNYKRTKSVELQWTLFFLLRP